MKSLLAHNKLLSVLSIVAIIVFTLVLVLNIVTPASANMNLSVSDSNVKIIIGAGGDMAPRGYSNSRSAFLAELSEQNPDTIYSAVISLNNYYTENEINELITQHDMQVERIYMWAPGETGKLSLAVENNDISAAKESFIAKMNGPLGESDEIQGDVQRFVNGDFKIYALTIVGSAQELMELSTTESKISNLDVKYNPDAEAYAVQNDMNYSYIELPDKPDAAY